MDWTIFADEGHAGCRLRVLAIALSGALGWLKAAKSASIGVSVARLVEQSRHAAGVVRLVFECADAASGGYRLIRPFTIALIDDRGALLNDGIAFALPHAAPPVPSWLELSAGVRQAVCRANAMRPFSVIFQRL
jgi:hypothetical protein